MNHQYPDFYSRFPMQAALGLYSLHKHVPDEDEEENEDEVLQYFEREGAGTCTSEKKESVVTKDMKL